MKVIYEDAFGVPVIQKAYIYFRIQFFFCFCFLSKNVQSFLWRVPIKHKNQCVCVLTASEQHHAFLQVLL